ncbi:hypothetical protein T440DRAFT_317348 [Plenodomus tracheiphilus IPT5]|uniref:Uncharacterized protein n=1 Tax=Plenodomus tracheiphilus IPT5 TaxID=1408161 RepID=A0A6A7AMS2_9PLEO|nr:hypothetical protein T440DRAFT_317348 [Plenodomus tracheiphilus IPT5]
MVYARAWLADVHAAGGDLEPPSELISLRSTCRSLEGAPRHRPTPLPFRSHPPTHPSHDRKDRALRFLRSICRTQSDSEYITLQRLQCRRPLGRQQGDQAGGLEQQGRRGKQRRRWR